MHPDLLPHVTPIVLTALTSPEIALYATMALKDMSRDCAGGMKPYSEVRNKKGLSLFESSINDVGPFLRFWKVGNQNN